MPEQIPFTVKFPDGQSVTFKAPSEMSDSDVYTRALQERDIQSGKIPSSFMAGAAPEGAQAVTQAGLSAAGYATGNPALVAAGPLSGRFAKFLAQKATGQDAPLPDVGETATLAAQGIVPAYGPGLLARLAGPVAKAVGSLPVNTLPQAIAKGTVPAVQDVAAGAEALSPKAIGATIKSMFSSGAKPSYSAIDVLRIQSLMKSGVSQQDAIKAILSIKGTP